MVHASVGDGEALQASQEGYEETTSGMDARWQEEAVEEHCQSARVVVVDLFDHLCHACGHEDRHEVAHGGFFCRDEPRDPRTLDLGKDQSRGQNLCLQRREMRPGCSGDWRQSPRSCCCSCFYCSTWLIQ